MEQYELKQIINDEEVHGEEQVTAEFTKANDLYSLTFNKSDLEVLNAWIYRDGHSLPAELSAELIEQVREEVKNRI